MTSMTDTAGTRRQRNRAALREAGPIEVSTMLSETSAADPADASAAAAPGVPAAARPAGPGFLSGTAGESVPVSHGGRTYQVRDGDDLFSVASRFGVSVPALVELNRLRGRARLRSGQVLSLPERQLPLGPATVRVQPGDTLEAIAAAHHRTVGDLRRANAIADAPLIVEGELLSLSGSGAMSQRPLCRAEDLGDLPLVAADTAAYPPETVLAARVNKRTLMSRPLPSRRAARRLIAAIAAEHGFDPELASAVAQLESGWHHGVVSPGNAVGVMQVTPRAAWAAGQRAGHRLDVLNVRDNITAGVVILTVLREVAADDREMLAAYYQGLASVRAHGAYADAARFAANVLVIADRLRAEVRR